MMDLCILVKISWIKISKREVLCFHFFYFRILETLWLKSNQVWASFSHLKTLERDKTNWNHDANCCCLFALPCFFCSLCRLEAAHVHTRADRCKTPFAWFKNRTSCFTLIIPSQQCNILRFNCCWHSFFSSSGCLGCCRRHWMIRGSEQTTRWQQSSVICPLRLLGVVSTMTALQTEKMKPEGLANNSKQTTTFHIFPDLWASFLFFLLPSLVRRPGLSHLLRGESDEANRARCGRRARWIVSDK